jgi:hypothetical protein
MQILMSALSLLLMMTIAATAQTLQVDGIDFTEYGIYTLDRMIEERDAIGIAEATGANISSRSDGEDNPGSDRHRFPL